MNVTESSFCCAETRVRGGARFVLALAAAPARLHEVLQAGNIRSR